MQKRSLGTSGLQIAPLVFGGNVFGWTADEAQSFRLLDAFVDAGFNAIDTADVYTAWIPGNKGGESETIIGRWLHQRGRRADIVLFSKCGFDMPSRGKGLSRHHILTSAEDSLRRLQTDCIDLYQAHTDDETVPQEETLAAYDTFLRDGKIRAIGASNFSAARLASACAISREKSLPRFQSLQPQYNLYDRAGFERELQPLCLAENIGVICYYALARGFLSGKYRSEADIAKSTRGESVAKNYFNDRGRRILAALDRAVEATGARHATISLAWLMSRPGVTAPIASATTVEQLDDIIAAAHLPLPPAVLADLDAASAYNEQD